MRLPEDDQVPDAQASKLGTAARLEARDLAHEEAALLPDAHENIFAARAQLYGLRLRQGPDAKRPLGIRDPVRQTARRTGREPELFGAEHIARLHPCTPAFAAQSPPGGCRMEASAIELAKHVLLACGVVLAAGVLSGLVAQKLAVPDVVVFLLVGI